MMDVIVREFRRIFRFSDSSILRSSAGSKGGAKVRKVHDAGTRPRTEGTRIHIRLFGIYLEFGIWN